MMMGGMNQVRSQKTIENQGKGEGQSAHEVGI